uniref:Si:ch211-252f13.5 n=1 Tax=Kryptolebias marmoratus TaxID=37003 RepID=A0A3Q3A1R3_KRYMA
LAPYTIIHPHQHEGFTQQQHQQGGSDGTRRTNPRTITAEVFHPGCAGGTCPSTVSQQPTGDDGSARECKGIGCKLPSRMRQKQKPCGREGCSAHAGDDASRGPSPVHVTDRAAQYLDEVPDFGSERGAWIQLACDIKPSNELPSEDALVLQLQLSKSQERLVEALRGQQDEIKQLQRLLSEQQAALVSQQREILQQQKRMYEQMEQQDRDECLEITGMCGDQQKCLNTPGFRCQGMTIRDASSGMCGHGYFYNSDMEECQACNECDGEPVVSPCTFVTDTLCTGPAAEASELSLSWAGDVSLQGSKGHVLAGAFSSVQLHIQGRGDAGLVSAEKGHLVLRQHGLVWVDGSLALSHGCRSFVQVCLRLNNSDGSEGRDLSGVRVEQQERRSLQSVSVSGVAEVAPGHIISLFLRSATHQCNQSSEGLQLYDASAAPLSLLWLSHDTGAVAMTAQALVSAHYHTNYHPAFHTTSTSDPYIVGLTHDSRGIRFAESGTVRFVFQQALYSMGQACVSEGFQLAAYLNQNGTSAELFRVFKPGVHYRDTSISISGATKVSPGDAIDFEILSPAQCNVRFFGDGSGISLLSLFWVPAAISSFLTASVANSGLPSGAVRNKPLFFHQTSPRVSQMGLLGKGSLNVRRDFVFRESGTVSMTLDLKLIHSCNLVKVTLLMRRDSEGSRGGHEAEGLRPVHLAQQSAGQMLEGSQWASVSFRTSFQVYNGTAVFFLLDCVRGRVNQISHQTGSGVSVLWVA